MLKIIFIALALTIIFPLLPPGYLLSLDVFSVPQKMPWISFGLPLFFFGNFLAGLNFFLPSYWIQKLMLLTIFFLAGWGMARLVHGNRAVKIFAGLFYAVNPFVYERVMAGHWEFLVGYAVFPLVVSAAKNFCKSPGWKSALILALLTTLSVNFANHWSIILAIFLFVYFSTYLFTHRENVLSFFKFLGLFGLVTLVLNLNWFIPALFLGDGTAGGIISQFGRGDLVMFQSVPDKNFGVIFNLLSGYGFWIEAQKYFISPKDIIFFWPIISVTFILLAVAGVYKIFKNREDSSLPFAVTLVILFLLALDFAGGVALPAFSGTVLLLYEKIPFLYGLREPQKLVAVIMFCYAYFGAVGLTFILEKVKPAWKYAVLCVFFILPFIYTPTIFGSFWGQLRPVSYPQSWFKVNEQLNKDKDKYLTLFFPWHQYMRFGFANNLVLANPAPRFFTKSILSSQNYETKSLYSHDIRPEALHIEGLLSMEKEGVNLAGEPVFDRVVWGEAIGAIGVKYIILAKESDWGTYRFLDKSRDLEKIFEDESLILYRNSAWQKDSLLE